ncbi:unnamed protein product [Amoebophrya sp. A120]|nr:unnamed protein product [Amoebophrya sp. A120]|eukprot:GSA120T00025667001.1
MRMRSVVFASQRSSASIFGRPRSASFLHEVHLLVLSDFLFCIRNRIQCRITTSFAKTIVFHTRSQMKNIICSVDTRAVSTATRTSTPSSTTTVGASCEESSSRTVSRSAGTTPTSSAGGSSSTTSAASRAIRTLSSSYAPSVSLGSSTSNMTVPVVTYTSRRLPLFDLWRSVGIFFLVILCGVTITWQHLTSSLLPASPKSSPDQTNPLDEVRGNKLTTTPPRSLAFDDDWLQLKGENTFLQLKELQQEQLGQGMTKMDKKHTVVMKTGEDKSHQNKKVEQGASAAKKSSTTFTQEQQVAAPKHAAKGKPKGKAKEPHPEPEESEEEGSPEDGEKEEKEKHDEDEEKEDGEGPTTEPPLDDGKMTLYVIIGILLFCLLVTLGLLAYKFSQTTTSAGYGRASKGGKKGGKGGKTMGGGGKGKGKMPEEDPFADDDENAGMMDDYNDDGPGGYSAGAGYGDDQNYY